MRIKSIAALLALPLLAACAPEVESTIYTADLAKVAASGESLSVPAVLRIPQSSEDDCKKGLDQLIANLKTLAPVSGRGTCIEKSGDQLAEIETEMVIATPGSDIPEPNLFLLEVGPAGEHGSPLKFRMLKPIDTITKALTAGSDAFQTDFDPAKFIFTLNNDGEAGVTLYPAEVFLDGIATTPEANVTKQLGRRDTTEVRFSDVASSWVELGSGYTFGSLASQ